MGYGLTSPVHGLSDSEAPQLVGLSFSPTGGDTGSGPVEITVTAHITDDASGFAFAQGTFKAPSPSQQVRSFSINASDLVSGSTLDGIYQVTTTFPQFGTTGTWSLDATFAFFFQDATGNRRDFTRADLTNAGFPTQLTFTGVSDSSAPQLVGLSFSPTGGDTGSGPVEITVTAHITDDASGFAFAQGTFKAPSPSQQVRSFSINASDLVSGSTLDGIYQVTTTFPQFGTTGTWSLDATFAFFFQDATGNRRDFTRADLTNAGFPTQLTFTGVSDSSAPQLVGLSFSPTGGDTGSGPVAITVTAHITDDASGFGFAQGTFKAPSPSQQVRSFSINASDLVSGSTLDGIYQVTTTFPQFGTTGTWSLDATFAFFFQDATGNRRDFTRADLTNAGFPTQLTFTDTPATTVPDAPTIGTALAGNTSASVSFTPPTNNGGSAITSYTATCTSSNGGTSGTLGGSGSPIAVAGLTNGRTYTCTVTATNANGASIPSSASNSFVPATVPGPPTGVSASSGSTTTPTGPVVVSFAPAGDNGAPITSFTATCTSSNGGVSGTTTAAGSPLTVNGLTTGKTYTCTVTATNAARYELAIGALDGSDHWCPGIAHSADPHQGCCDIDQAVLHCRQQQRRSDYELHRDMFVIERRNNSIREP